MVHVEFGSGIPGAPPHTYTCQLYLCRSCIPIKKIMAPLIEYMCYELGTCPSVGRNQLNQADEHDSWPPKTIAHLPSPWFCLPGSDRWVPDYHAAFNLCVYGQGLGWSNGQHNKQSTFLASTRLSTELLHTLCATTIRPPITIMAVFSRPPMTPCQCYTR